MLALATPDNLRLLMGFSFFPIGLIAILSGMVMLVAGPYRKESQALAAHSARIGQKGLTDDISAVAQSATALIEAVNRLMQTSSGNAVVLIGIGALLEAAAYWLLVAGL
jgi:hypothetical protein